MDFIINVLFGTAIAAVGPVLIIIGLRLFVPKVMSGRYLGLTLSAVLAISFLYAVQTYGPRHSLDSEPRQAYTPQAGEVVKSETLQFEGQRDRVGQFDDKLEDEDPRAD